ncbi:hypothetical protein FRC07_011506 [Ceratobasidium sp. 392]|nr:hypothetical protein FRC07_011506 [Ceratobasidium sp. 392]
MAKATQYKQKKLSDKLALASHSLGITADALKSSNSEKLSLSQQLESTKGMIASLQATLDELCQQNLTRNLLLSEKCTKIDKQQKLIQQLKSRNRTLERSHDALHKRTARAPSQTARKLARSALEASASDNQQTLKDTRGIIKPEVRNLLRKLASQQVATERMVEVICCVAKSFGVSVGDSVSTRSISRIVLEGLIQAQMQIAFEISNTTYLSICGDGTEIKNQQHEARLIRMPVAPYVIQDPPDQHHTQVPPTLRTLGVQKAPNHTAASQLEGWKSTIDACCRLLSRSPLGESHSASLPVPA